MYITTNMMRLLDEICALEPKASFTVTKDSASRLLHQLIDCYHQTESTKVKKLIRNFMQHAGPKWQAKLEASESHIPQIERLSTLSDYLKQVPANDPMAQWSRAAE